jgi:hypothetical protein
MEEQVEQKKAEAAKPSTLNLADLSSSKEDEGQKMEVRHPGTGDVLRHDDGRPYTITLVGKDSDRFLQLQRQIQDRRLTAMARTRQPMTASLSERDEVDLLVNATLTWDVVFGDNGSSEPKPDNYRRAYTSLRWLRKQVDEFVGSPSNFFRT